MTHRGSLPWVTSRVIPVGHFCAFLQIVISFISNMRSWGNGVWRSSSRQIRKVTRRRVTFSFSLDVSLSAFPWTLPPVSSSKFGSRFSFFHTYQGPKAYQKLSFQKKTPLCFNKSPPLRGALLGGAGAGHRW